MWLINFRLNFPLPRKYNAILSSWGRFCKIKLCKWRKRKREQVRNSYQKLIMFFIYKIILFQLMFHALKLSLKRETLKLEKPVESKLKFSGKNKNV